MKKTQISDIMELMKCSNEKCKDEMKAYKKVQDVAYNKLKKNQNKKENIIKEINNRKETIDFIKCRIANCNSYIRNAVKYIIINNNMKNIKITNPIDIKNMFIKLGIIYS
jgi:hypothetical protein